MSPTLTWRRQPRDAELELLQDVDLPAVSQWTGGPALATKAATVGLWAMLLAGPAGLLVGGVALVSAAQPASRDAVTSVDQSRDRAAAGEFAQRLVVTWLTSSRGQENNLVSLGQSSNVTLPEVPFTAMDPTVSSIQQVSGVWSVTVAVTVADQSKTQARRFYQVPILVSGGGTVTALSLPAPVAAPPVGSSVQLGYQFQVDATGPVAQTVAQFLGAYVAGQGDVTRYVSPSTQISSVLPAPYTAVTVTDLLGDTDLDTSGTPKDRTRLRVLVSADVTADDKQQLSVAYALTLVARAGRWEVAAIDPVPALTPPQTPTAGPAAGSPSAPAQGPTSTTTAGSSTATTP
jgi:hypothetical protein